MSGTGSLNFSPPSTFVGSFDVDATTYKVAGIVNSASLPDLRCKEANLLCPEPSNLQNQPQCPFIATMAEPDENGAPVVNFQMANGAVIICKLAGSAYAIDQPLSGVANWSVA
ncbi:hypothetical protein CVT24_005660 [Panaeolus cyanescens]|uniref:Uncharacterized protein n=1 Tax=Panaeolus cyanescens TaxID=181874 RepID=A0A409VD35_9AGAR|nr:hypothetical protein CVT24_005660 [Panaeolus cyanescens]